MPNWKSYESAVRLLSAIIAADPTRKLNYEGEQQLSFTIMPATALLIIPLDIARNTFYLLLGSLRLPTLILHCQMLQSITETVLPTRPSGIA